VRRYVVLVKSIGILSRGPQRNDNRPLTIRGIRDSGQHARHTKHESGDCDDGFRQRPRYVRD
jgi:hypothetical protein